MDFLKRNFKNILVALVIAAVCYFGYSYFFAGSSSSATLSVSSPAAVDDAVGKDLLLLLADLHTITLDESIFSNPAFQNLKNYRVELTPEPVGRDNPFAPLSGAASAASSNQGVSIKSFKTQ